MYTLNDGEKTPNTKEIKDGRGTVVPEDNVRTITIRVQDITPRIANAAIAFNAQYVPGVELPIVPVYGYEIGDDVELEVRAYNTKTKTYDYKKGLTDVIKIDYDSVTGKYYMKARENTREEVNAYGSFTPLYKSLKIGGNASYSQIAIHGTYSTLLTDGVAMTFDIPLTSIKVSNQLPNPTLKTSGSINLFYKGWFDYNADGTVDPVAGSGKAFIDQTTTKIVTDSQDVPTISATNGWYLVSNENKIRYGEDFDPSVTTDDAFANNYVVSDATTPPAVYSKFSVVRSRNDLAKDSAGKGIASGWLYLNYNNYRTPVMKQITIPNKTVAPSYNIAEFTTGSANVTANTFASDQKYQFYFYDKADKSKKAIQLSYLTADAPNDIADVKLNRIKTTYGLFNETSIIKTGYTYLCKNNPYDTIELPLISGITPFKGTAAINLHMNDWENDDSYLSYNVNLSVNNTKPTVTASTKSISINKAYDRQVGQIILSSNQRDSRISGLKDYNYTSTAGKNFNEIKFVSYSGSAYKTQAEKETAALALINVIKTSSSNFSNPSEIDLVIYDTQYSSIGLGTYNFTITPKVVFDGSEKEIEVNQIAFSVVVTNNKPMIKLSSTSFPVNAAAGIEWDTHTNNYSITNPSVDYVNGVMKNTVTGDYTVKLEKFTPVNITTPAMDGTFTFDATTGKVKFENRASVPKTATYSYKTDLDAGNNYVTLKLHNPRDNSEITTKAGLNAMSFSITKNIQVASVAYTQSGTINLIDANSAVTFKATPKNTTGYVEDVILHEYDPATGIEYTIPDPSNPGVRIPVVQHFILDKSTIETTGIATLKARDKSDIESDGYKYLAPGKEYKIKLEYKLSTKSSSEPLTSAITIKPVQTFPTVTNKAQKSYMYIGDVGNDASISKVGVNREKATVYGTITVANLGATMDGLILDSSMNELIRKGFKVECKDSATGKYVECDVENPCLTLGYTEDLVKKTKTYEYRITFTGDPKAAVVQNKTYTISLTPHYKNQVDKTNAPKTNVSINIRK